MQPQHCKGKLFLALAFKKTVGNKADTLLMEQTVENTDCIPVPQRAVGMHAYIHVGVVFWHFLEVS